MMKMKIQLISNVLRMWKYGTKTIANSEFLLYSSLIEMLEFDDDVFAAGPHHHHHQHHLHHYQYHPHCTMRLST